MKSPQLVGLIAELGHMAPAERERLLRELATWITRDVASGNWQGRYLGPSTIDVAPDEEIRLGLRCPDEGASRLAALEISLACIGRNLPRGWQ